jgi:hypothetical protein
VAAVTGLVLGDALLWVATTWTPPNYAGFAEHDRFDTVTTVAMFVSALVKAALLWLILRAPVPGPMNRQATALRWLLYLAVAYTLFLWYPIALFPGGVDLAFELVLFAAIDVLYLFVIRWRSGLLRAAAGVLFAIELAGMANDLLDQLDLLELPLSGGVGLFLMLSGPAAIVITVMGQWRDGRWSRGTLTAGWLSVGVLALALPLNILLESISGGHTVVWVVMDAVQLVSLVWMAATARELPTEERLTDLRPGRQRALRVAVATVAVLPVITQIHPEESAHLSYSGWSTECYDRPSFGDLKPEERDAMFLCLARNTAGGVPPMFPDSLSDQGVLAYGRSLCRAKDREEQEAILKRAGSERPAWGADPRELVYVCPEIIAATRPELLRSTAAKEAANDSYIAEANAKCRDPWPRRKGVVQATANYFLFVDGDHGYVVQDPEDEAAEGAMDRAVDELYDDDGSPIGVAGSTVLVGHVEDVSDLCLTVKAFRTAPPLRTAGWELVNEVPIVSRSGRLSVPEMGDGEVGAGAPMPNLAIAGKGRYRLRVYVRLGETGEEHLVIVFPGASKKRLKVKP